MATTAQTNGTTTTGLLTNRQMVALKKKHKDTVMLFRCGSFYEMINEDAEISAKVLGLTLVDWSKSEVAGLNQKCSFPYCWLDIALPRLVRANYRVVIANPVEE